MAELRQYMKAHGAFSARVTKHAITVDASAFEGGTHGNLAFYLFTRRLSSFTIKATVTEKELSAFLSVVSKDRLTLEASSGVAYLLWQADVKDIEVMELTLKEQAEQETLGLNAFYALIGRSRLTPAERERVAEILRAGPDQIARLLENLYAATEDAFKGISQAERVQHVCQAIRTLDRLILDEPLEEHASLQANLAAAPLHVAEPLKPSLQQVVMARAEDDPAMAALMDQLPADQLAQILFGALSPTNGASGNVSAEQVLAYLQRLTPDREKVQAVVASLEARLRPEEPRGWLVDAVLPHLRPQEARSEPYSLMALELDSSLVALSEEEFAQQLREAQAIDEATAPREVVRTLVEVLRLEEDPDNMTAVAESLAAYLPWMVKQDEVSLLAEVLTGVKAFAISSHGRRRELASGILKKAAEDLLGGLLDALWTARGTAAEKEIQRCFQILADRVVGRLVQALGDEPRAAMRAVLCDLLVFIGQEHLEELGGFVGDSRWYLVRNIASILGRLRNPKAMVYLRKVTDHGEYRVRREVVDALANIGTPDAVALQVTFLDDPDQRIRLRALESLDARGVHEALPKLVALLNARDPFNRMFVLKQAAIEVLGRTGEEEALPALRRLARRRLVFGWRGRELRRLAGMAAGIIETQAPRGQPELMTAS